MVGSSKSNGDSKGVVALWGGERSVNSFEGEEGFREMLNTQEGNEKGIEYIELKKGIGCTK